MFDLFDEETDCEATDDGEGFTCANDNASVVCADNRCCLETEGDEIPNMCCSEALAGCCLTEATVGDDGFICFDEEAGYLCGSTDPESLKECELLEEEFFF